MTIAEVRQKCKNALAHIPRDILLLCTLIGTSTLSFGFGYLAGQDGVKATGQASVAIPEETITLEGKFVASKSGTKYYLPSCSGAKRISEANMVWFSTAEAATSAGYSPAVNCPGI